MKRLFEYVHLFVKIIIIFLPTTLFGQQRTPVANGIPNGYVHLVGSALTDSVFALPVRDTINWNYNTFRRLGRLTIRPQDSRLYYNNGTKWVRLALSTDIANETDPIWLSQKGNYYTKSEADSLYLQQGEHEITLSDLDSLTIKWGNTIKLPYLRNYTETDPTVASHVKGISTNNISNWNSAFSWGNHAGAGYEVASNKATSFATVNNTLFPSVQAVKTYVDNAVAAIDLSNYLTISSAAASYVSLSGSYTNPAWITSLPWSKITATPTTIAGYGISDYNSLWDARLATKSTGDLAEGSNLYFTNARARAAISETITGISYDNSTGVLSQTSGYIIPTTTQETTWNGKQNAITTGPSTNYLKADLSQGTFQTDVRAQFTAGTGISLSSGTIANTGVTSVNGSTGALTGYITGSGTSGFIPRRNGSTSLIDGIIQDDGTNIGIGGAPISGWKATVYGGLRTTGDFMLSRDNFNSSTNLIRGNQWITYGESIGVGTVFSTRCNTGDANAIYFRMGANGRTESQATVVATFLQSTTYRNYFNWYGYKTIYMDNTSDPLLRLAGFSGYGFQDIRMQFLNSFNIVQAETRSEDMDVSNKALYSIWVNTGGSANASSLERVATFDGLKRVSINVGSKTSNAGGGWTTDPAQFNVQSGAASRQVAIFKGAASQTANLTEWRNSAGTVLSAITADGLIRERELTSSQISALTPDGKWTVFCTDCTATDGSTGVLQTYNGTTWKNHW